MNNHITYLPGSVVAFTGLPGSGKTGLMTYFARQLVMYQTMYLAANYTLHNVQYKHISRYDQLQHTNTVICLDELQLLAGSREFKSSANKTLSEFVELDIRKPKNILFYTTQDFDMVDVNVRRLTSELFDLSIMNQYTDDMYSVVARFVNMRYSHFVDRGRFAFPHRLFYGMYDTYDRKVRLV
jgi:hypothetical protein